MSWRPAIQFRASPVVEQLLDVVMAGRLGVGLQRLERERGDVARS